MKPIAWYDPTNGVVSTDKDSPLFTPLGQVWPLFSQRTWVGLTDEERNQHMTTYKELGDLMRNLPTDETWLPLFLGRLKEKEPEIYQRMMELANDKLKEKT